MEVHEIINRIARGRYKSYLEIGVGKGKTINKIEVPRKVGVDYKIYSPPQNLHCEFHALTSDTYFGVYEENFDIIFIDGSKVFEHAKRDFLNAANRLNDDGMIIFNHCIPVKEIYGDDFGGNSNELYKVIAWINDYTPYSYSFLCKNRNIIKIWKTKTKREKLFTYNPIQIDELTIEEFVKKSPKYNPRNKISLMLKSKKNILQKIKSSLLNRF